MSVEWRLRQYAQSLGHTVHTEQHRLPWDRIDVITRQVFAKTDRSEEDAVAGRPCGAVPEIPVGPAGPSLAPESGPDDQHALTLTREDRLHYYRTFAEKGEATSARRVAEILEFLGRADESEAWWRHAARLGDPDAIACLEDFEDTSRQLDERSGAPTLRHIS
jgi:hypothetical protein